MTRRSAARGKALEAWLAQLHDLYQRQGRAYVHHAHPPVVVAPRTTRKDKRGRTVFTGWWGGKGPPDFYGLAGGDLWVFDAKTHSQPSPRWPLAGLPLHQAQDFDSVEQQGGRAFVLLYLQAEAQGWVLPWGTWAGEQRSLAARYWHWHRSSTVVGRRAKGGTASLLLTDLAEVGLSLGALGQRQPSGQLGGDWLTVCLLQAALAGGATPSTSGGEVALWK